MKFFRVPIFLFAVIALWSVAHFITKVRLSALEKSGELPYGPVPVLQSPSYSYQGLRLAFDPRVPLKRAEEFPKAEFESLILSSLSRKEQLALKPYISSTLNFSVDYQIDPFWIISIIMVESHFKLRALSPKNARGLMQIKPDTAQDLYQLMQKTLSDAEVEKNLYHPDENIEIGVFYLKRLLQNFRMNYHFATVAYNIGPGKLKTRLSEKSLDVANFSYLVKVRNRYMQLSQNFLAEAKKRSKPFEMTYVVLDQGLKLEEEIINLSSGTTSENLMALNTKY